METKLKLKKFLLQLFSVDKVYCITSKIKNYCIYFSTWKPCHCCIRHAEGKGCGVECRCGPAKIHSIVRKSIRAVVGLLGVANAWGWRSRSPKLLGDWTKNNAIVCVWLWGRNYGTEWGQMKGKLIIIWKIKWKCMSTFLSHSRWNQPKCSYSRILGWRIA